MHDQESQILTYLSDGNQIQIYTQYGFKLEMFTTVLKMLTTLVIQAIVHIFPKCLLEVKIQ